MSKSQAYHETYLLTRQTLDAKRAKCKPGNKNCGEICIPNEQECHEGKTKQKAIKAKGRGVLIAGGLLAGAGAIAAGAVLAGRGKSKPLGLGIEPPVSPPAPAKKSRTALKVGSVAAAGVVGAVAGGIGARIYKTPKDIHVVKQHPVTSHPSGELSIVTPTQTVDPPSSRITRESPPAPRTKGGDLAYTPIEPDPWETPMGDRPRRRNRTRPVNNPVIEAGAAKPKVEVVTSSPSIATPAPQATSRSTSPTLPEEPKIKLSRAGAKALRLAQPYGDRLSQVKEIDGNALGELQKQSTFLRGQYKNLHNPLTPDYFSHSTEIRQSRRQAKQLLQELSKEEKKLIKRKDRGLFDQQTQALIERHQRELVNNPDAAPVLTPALQALQKTRQALAQIDQQRQRLTGISQDLERLPTNMAQLDNANLERYKQTKKVQKLAQQLPGQVGEHQKSHAQISADIQRQGEGTEKLAADYQAEMDTAKTGLAPYVEARRQYLQQQMKMLELATGPEGIKWVTSKAQDPALLEFALSRGRSAKTITTVEEAAQFRDYVAGQLHGRINTVVKDLNEKLAYPSEIQKRYQEQVDQTTTGWDAIQKQSVNHAKAGDRLAKAVLKQGQEMSAQLSNQGGLLQIQREGAELATGQLQEMKRGQQQQLKAGIEATRQLRDRLKQDVEQPLSLDVGGASKTLEEIKTEAEAIQKRAVSLRTVREIEAKAEAMPESLLEDASRRMRRIQVTEVRSKIAQIQEQMGAVNLQINKKREAAQRGQKRGTSTGKLEAELRGLQKQMTDLAESLRQDALESAKESSDTSKADPKMTLAKAVRDLLGSVYDGNISSIPVFNVKPNGALAGQFVGEEDTYDFEISPKGRMSYVEAQRRSDSYIDVYYARNANLRLDGLRVDFQKPRNCTQGKSCGETCIEKGNRCNTDLPSAAKQALPRVQKAALAAKAGNLEQVAAILAGAAVVGVAGAVAAKSKGSIPQLPELPISNNEPSKKSGTEPNATKIGFDKPSPSALKAMAIGAAIVGVPIASYAGARARYRAGFTESARQAEAMAKDITPGSVKAQQQSIIFGSGGAAYAQESPSIVSGERIVTSFKMAFSDNKGKDFKLVPVSNVSGNYPIDKPRGTQLGTAVDIVRLHAKTMLKGRNPAAVELAAHVIAYGDAYPDRPLVMAGHSMGGMIIHEAQEILRRARPDYEKRLISLCFGSQWYGATNKFGESYTIGSPNDTYTTKYPTRDLQLFPNVPGHMQEGYFRDPDVKKFVREKLAAKINKPDNKASSAKADASDRRPVIDPEERTLKIMVARLLLKKFREPDGITRFLRFEINPQTLAISGIFSSGQRFYEFLIDGKDVGYKQIAKRSDADAQAVRYDKTKRKARCTVGTSCGETCIEAGDVCSFGKEANPLELQAIRQAAEVVVKPEAKKTIRELKAQARDLNIYRYSNMTSRELSQAIETAKEDPQQQERLRKTLERNRQERNTTYSILPTDLVKAWKDLQKVGKMFGVNPERAGLLAATVLLGSGLSATQRMKDRYKANLQQSAQQAFNRAQSVPIQRTNKENILFSVGGFQGIGSTGERMRDMLQAPQDNSTGEKWFSKNNHFVPFNNREFDIPTPSVSQRKPDGSYNPVYLGAVARGGFGKFLENFRRGSNEASIDLAAQIYAYGNRYPKAQINLLGHGAGGNVVREAVEIVNRMRPPEGKGMRGSELLNRFNIVNLGTPYFGFTDDKAWGKVRERTITSSQDPFSFLPKRMSQWISTVKGHEPQDYLKNDEVRERLREAFGYYSNSLTGLARQQQQRQANQKAIGQSLDIVSPALGKTWYAINALGDRARENPVAAGILAAGLTTGGVLKARAWREQQYQDNLNRYAPDAEQMSRELSANLGKVPNSNVAVVVGGNGVSSNQLKDDLLQAKGLTPKERENFRRRNKIVALEREAQEQIPEDIPSGSAEHMGYQSVRYIGKQVDQITGYTRNQEAIRLAAQLHAYGSLQVPRSGKVVQLPINVLATGDGGMVTRQAMDILLKMENGSAIAKRVKVVTLGTPYFGLAGKKAPETSLLGDGDRWSWLPFQRGGGQSRTVKGVGSSDPQSYFDSKEAMQKMLNAFNVGGRTRVVPGAVAPLSKRQSSIATLPPRLQRIANQLGAQADPRNRPDWKTLPKADRQRLYREYTKLLNRIAGEELKNRREQQFTKDAQDTRMDRKRAQCKPGNKNCGEICIPNEQECHAEKSKPEASGKKRGTGGLIKSAAVQVASAALVTAASVVTAKALQSLQANEIIQIPPKPKKSNTLQRIAIAGAGLGVGVGAGALVSDRWLRPRLEKDFADAQQHVKQSFNRRSQELEAQYQRKLEVQEQSLRAKYELETNAKVANAQADLDAKLQQQTAATNAKSAEEVRRQVQVRRQELEGEYQEKLKQESAAVEQRVHQASIERIAQERELISQAAQEQLRIAAEPKARRPGDLIRSEKGINLSASIRQGMAIAPGVIGQEALGRKIRDSLTRAMSEQQAESMKVLAENFRDRAKIISSISGTQNRWEALEQTLVRQNQREGYLDEEMSTLRKEVVRQHQALIDKLYTDAGEVGDFSPTLLTEFDRQAAKLHAQMLRETRKITRGALDEVRWDGKGKPCGESFIPRKAKCHEGEGSAPKETKMKAKQASGFPGTPAMKALGGATLLAGLAVGAAAVTGNLPTSQFKEMSKKMMGIPKNLSMNLPEIPKEILDKLPDQLPDLPILKPKEFKAQHRSLVRQIGEEAVKEVLVQVPSSIFGDYLLKQKAGIFPSALGNLLLQDVLRKNIGSKLPGITGESNKARLGQLAVRLAVHTTLMMPKLIQFHKGFQNFKEAHRQYAQEAYARSKSGDYNDQDYKDYFNDFYSRQKQQAGDRISPDEKPWYEVLGVSKNATPQEVRTAYRKLSRENHPDLNKTAEATSRMQEINLAFERSGKRRDAFDLLYAAYQQGMAEALNRHADSAYAQSYLRTDKISKKKPDCDSGNKLCGYRCVPAKFECKTAVKAKSRSTKQYKPADFLKAEMQNVTFGLKVNKGLSAATKTALDSWHNSLEADAMPIGTSPDVWADAKTVDFLQSFAARMAPEKVRHGVDRFGRVQAIATVSTGEHVIDSIDFTERDVFWVDTLRTNPRNLNRRHPSATKGAGTAMMAGLIQESIDRGYKGEMWLFPTATAEPFYEKLGFETVDGLNFRLPPEKGQSWLAKYKAAKAQKTKRQDADKVQNAKAFTQTEIDQFLIELEELNRLEQKVGCAACDRQRKHQDSAVAEPSKRSINAQFLMHKVIQESNPNVQRVLSVKVTPKSISGHYTDHKNRLYRYQVTGDRLKYAEVPARQRSDRMEGDNRCVKGTDCGKSCVERGSVCNRPLSPVSQQLVGLVRKTIETEELPSKRELVQAAFGIAMQGASNPIKFFNEGMQRERVVREALEEKMGVKIPSKLELAKKFHENNPEVAHEVIVMAVGLTTSNAGAAALGPVGGIAAEAASTAITRRGLSDYRALQLARKKLEHDEAFQAAGRLDKLKLLQKEAIAQAKARKVETNQNVAGDIGGAVGGGIAGNVGAAIGGSFPVAGNVLSLVVGASSGISAGITSSKVASKTVEKVQQQKSITEAAKEASGETLKEYQEVTGQVAQAPSKEKQVRQAATRTIKTVKKVIQYA
jgi:hypothetical protein